MTDFLHQAIAQQTLAADPQVSVWVSANAGTGKTRVLVQRLVNLLLAQPGLDPRSILALTYTRAAANEMRERLFKAVQHADTPELQSVAARLQYSQPHITTIHGWCQHLLQQFPLEANVPPGFTVLDAQTTAELWQQALNQAIRDLVQTSSWVAYVLQSQGEQTTRALARELREQREAQPTVLTSSGIAQTLAHWAAHFGVPVPGAPPTDATHLLAPMPAVQAALAPVLPQLLAGKSDSQQTGAGLAQFFALAPDTQARMAHQYAAVFLTQKGTPRKKLLAKAEAEKFPEILERLTHEQQRVVALQANQHAQHVLALTRGQLDLTLRAVALYQAAKWQRGGLDFADLILQTQYLLQRSEQRAWLRYRLDAHIQHVLLDEAQDTDARQWHLLQPLVQEFFAGAGQAQTPRTVFVVGDEKQSIYRFRGAQPEVFQQTLTDFTTWDPTCTQHRPVRLHTSFRSAPAILQLVDQLANAPNVQGKLASEPVVHQAVVGDRFGQVILWPAAPYASAEVGEPWALPFRRIPTTGMAAVAQQIAGQIHTLLARAEPLTVTGAPPRLEDMLILMRSRTHLQTLVQVLQQQDIPVWIAADGQDGIDHPIVQDCLALLQFLRQPHEDIICAHVLRSPLVGWSDAELQAAALARKPGQSLWDACTVPTLMHLRDALLPAPLYQQLHLALDKLQGAFRFAQRFGGGTAASVLTVTTVLNGVLDHLYTFSQQRPEGTVLDYLRLLQAQGLPLQTAEHAPAGAVAIRTVHGAKGLEAPIVFLPDTMQKMDSTQNASGWIGGAYPIIRQPAEFAHPAQIALVTQEKQQNIQDELRLLYVALTRAAEELYIGGATPRDGIPEWSWYQLVQAVAVPDFGWRDGVLRSGQPLPAATLATVAPMSHVAKSGNVSSLPKWWHSPVTPRPISTVLPASQAQVQDVEAARRGTWVHRLWQYAPATLDQAQSVLSGAACPLSPAEVRTVLAQMQAVRACNPWVFGPYSRAEVQVGQSVLDRLIWHADAWVILDYKTAAPSPTMPAAYCNQLHIYTKLVQESGLGPVGAPVYAALLYLGAVTAASGDTVHWQWLDNRAPAFYRT